MIAAVRFQGGLDVVQYFEITKKPFPNTLMGHCSARWSNGDEEGIPSRVERVLARMRNGGGSGNRTEKDPNAASVLFR
jgi:hypothetical protein